MVARPSARKDTWGREYIDQEFPKLDSFIKCLVTEAQPGDNDMEEDGFATVDEESDVKITVVALDIEVDDEVVVEPSAEVEKRIGSPTIRVERIISEEGVLAATDAGSDVITIVMVSSGIFLAVLIILVMVSHFKLRRAKHNKASSRAVCRLYVLTASYFLKYAAAVIKFQTLKSILQNSC